MLFSAVIKSDFPFRLSLQTTDKTVLKINIAKAMINGIHALLKRIIPVRLVTIALENRKAIEKSVK